MLGQITSLFASFWEAWSSLVHPLLGISFGSILIGVFVVSLAARILVPILGIGNSAYTSIKDRPFRNERNAKRKALAEKQAKGK